MYLCPTILKKKLLIFKKCLQRIYSHSKSHRAVKATLFFCYITECKCIYAQSNNCALLFISKHKTIKSLTSQRMSALSACKSRVSVSVAISLHRVERSLFGGPLQRPLRIESSPLPAMSGVLASSCGRCFHMETSPMGICPIRR